MDLLQPGALAGAGGPAQVGEKQSSLLGWMHVCF